MAEVKDRKDIKEEYKWSLEDVFASDEEWEKAAAEVVHHAEKLSEVSQVFHLNLDAVLIVQELDGALHHILIL